MKRRIHALVLVLLTLFFAVFQTNAIEAKANIDASTAIGYGIDVSRYQGDIDWPAVKAGGVQFAIIRVGSVKWGMDAKFIKNITEANAAGIKCGVYIYSYAHSVEDAINEAMWVIQQIDPYVISMPVAIDIEDDIQKKMSPTEQAAMATAFCQVIESAGYYPIVYGSKSWYNNYMGPITYDKWIAQYYKWCARDDASIWQYSSTGAIPGINGNVDKNYLYKDYSKLIIKDGFQYKYGNYYFYSNYKLQRNLFIPVGDVGTYYVDEYGRMVTGLKQIGDGLFYFNNAGLMAVGLTEIAGKYYFFGNDGKMYFGAATFGDDSYYFDADGSMHTGWLLTDSAYYYGADGRMAKGLTDIAGNKYFFNDKGQMKTGWVLAGDKRFYFDGTTGILKTGLFTDGEYYYYADPALGYMSTGFVTLGKDIYFFDLNDGHLWTNTQVASADAIYVIDETGKVTIVPIAQ